MYSTGTKKDAELTSMDELKKIRDNVSIPIAVIGGINKDRIDDFKGTGIDGLAIVSAIIAQKDIKKSTEEIKEEFKKIIK